MLDKTRKGTILICPTRSCIFRGLSKGCRPAPSHSSIHSSLILPKFSTFVHLIRWGNNRHPQSVAIWDTASALPQPQQLNMLNSCCHSWLQLPMGDLNRDPPLSDHLLLWWWGNLPCRPCFRLASIQSCNSLYQEASKSQLQGCLSGPHRSFSVKRVIDGHHILK